MYWNKNKFRNIDVSEEYLQHLSDELKDWSAKHDSWIIAQFLKSQDIGWGLFKHFLSMSPLLQNTFDVTVSHLCSKWVMYALESKNMPAHMCKVLMKYLKVYDNHAFDIEHEARKQLAAAKQEVMTQLEFMNEDYSQEKLDGIYKDIYESQDNKRRGRKAT